MRLAKNLLTAVSVSAVLAMGQTPSATARPGFEVVSIRPAVPDAQDSFVMRQLGGGVINLQRYPLALLIQFALHVKAFEIAGLPPWVASARYDIQAKTAEPATAQEMWPMLLPILEERFQMKVHREKQEKPVYELSVSKSGKLSTLPDANCWDPRGPLPPPVRVAIGQRPFLACDSTMRLFQGRQGAKLWGTKIRMPTLVSALMDLLGRPVVDKTEFNGTFDLELTFAQDSTIVGSPPAEASDPSGAPSIFTAIQEQLGLKLKSAKDPVEVIVIDRIERPSDN